MTRRLFAGSRLDSIIPVSGTVAEITTAANIETAYSDAGVQISPTAAAKIGLYEAVSNVLSPTVVVAPDTFWFHTAIFISGNQNSAVNTVEFRDSSGFPWLALRKGPVNGEHQIAWNSGTGASPVWTLVGSIVNLPISGVRFLDISVTLGSPHAFEVFVGNTSVASGTFTQASFTEVAEVRFNGFVSIQPFTISQVLATENIPTVGAKVRTLRPSAVGNYTAWSGDHTNVNEAINSDATLNSSATAGQRETHAFTDVTVPSGFEIDSVFHWMRAKNDGSAPNNIRSLLRSGVVDYTTGDLSGIGLGYSPVGALYETNPGTGINWTEAGLNGYEFGYESAT